MNLNTKKVAPKLIDLNLRKSSKILVKGRVEEVEMFDMNPEMYSDSNVELKNLSTNSVSSNVANFSKDIANVSTTDAERIRKNEVIKKYREERKKYTPGSIEYRNAMLKYRIDYAGYGTRESVVAAAKYLSEEENVPYFWGGKSYKLGIDESWGSKRSQIMSDSIDQPLGTMPLNGLDCSGFVTWTLMNGGYKATDSSGDIVSYTENYKNLKGVKSYDFTVDSFNKKVKNEKTGKEEYLIKEGDLLYRNGHIAIITNINHQYNMITVAEERGYPLKDSNGNYIIDKGSYNANGRYSVELKGMEITTMKIDDYVNKKGDENHPKFTKILSMEDYYSNYDNVVKRNN